MRTALSAKKMTSQEKKDLERSGAKNKSKTKVWVKVSDKGSKNKRGKWTGNATFEFKGDDKKHAIEIPLRTGDVLKLKGKDLWVHPKGGDEFKFGDDEDEPDEPETDEDEDADDEEEAPPPKKKKKPKSKPEPEEDDDEDADDEDEGTGPLSDEEIAEMDEEDALAAEQEKLTLRKKALAAEKKARTATSRAERLRAQVGGSLKKQVEEEGIEKTSKSVAGKLVKVAAKLTLKGFVKALFLVGGAVQSGGKALKQLGPAIKKEIESERKKLAELQKSGMSDIIDAEFTVIDKNLKAVQDDKWLLGPVPSSGKLPPADDSDLPDSMSPKQLAAPQKKDKTKPPPLPKKKKPKPKAEDEDLPEAADEDVVEASLRRLEAALVKAGPNWSMSHPSYDSLDAMDPEDESVENSVKMLRDLARSKGNHLDATNLRILADALERGGVAQAVKRLKNIERSMDDDDFGRFSYLLPNVLLRNLR